MSTTATTSDFWVEGADIADTKAPTGLEIEKVWKTRQFQARLVNPANRRKLSVIIVGTGLAGGAAAAVKKAPARKPAAPKAEAAIKTVVVKPTTARGAAKKPGAVRKAAAAKKA